MMLERNGQVWEISGMEGRGSAMGWSIGSMELAVTYNGIGGRDVKGTEIYDIEMVWGYDRYVMGGDKHVTIDELHHLFGKATTKLGMVGGLANGKIIMMERGIIEDIVKPTIGWEIIEGRRGLEACMRDEGLETDLRDGGMSPYHKNVLKMTCNEN